MKTYSDTEAERGLAALLDEARKEGAVEIRTRDGQSFVVTPKSASRSPLDVPGVDLPVSSDEIVQCVRVGRRQA